MINEFVWSETVNDLSICDLYLHFSCHLMKLFHIYIKTFEQKSTNATNLFDLMINLKTKLENRQKLKFFGTKVDQNLKNFNLKDRESFLSNANTCYQRALNYLNDHFDYNNSIFKLLSKMNLDSSLEYNNLVTITSKLRITVDRDLLFDEINTFNEGLTELNAKDMTSDTITKYSQLLSSSESLNLIKIVETVLDFYPLYK